MSKFIRMPWDEPNQYRWSADEIALALRLHSEGLNRSEIADHLAVAGFPPRCETNIDHKLREVA